MHSLTKSTKILLESSFVSNKQLKFPLVVLNSRLWLEKPLKDKLLIILNGISPNELVKITILLSVRTITLLSLSKNSFS